MVTENTRPSSDLHKVCGGISYTMVHFLLDFFTEFTEILVYVLLVTIYFYPLVRVMAKWLDSGDLIPYEDQVGGHKFTKEKPLLGSYYNIDKYFVHSLSCTTLSYTFTLLYRFIKT